MDWTNLDRYLDRQTDLLVSAILSLVPILCIALTQQDAHMHANLDRCLDGQTDLWVSAILS